MNSLNYNYSGATAYAESLKLQFVESWVINFDQQAFAFNMTQAQVDMCLQHHFIHLRHVFTPQIYNWRQRLALALFFLFGRPV